MADDSLDLPPAYPETPRDEEEPPVYETPRDEDEYEPPEYMDPVDEDVPEEEPPQYATPTDSINIDPDEEIEKWEGRFFYFFSSSLCSN